MYKSILTYEESALLAAMSDDREMSYPELTTRTHLSPSDVSKAAASLATKGWVEAVIVTGGGAALRLTDAGRQARAELHRQTKASHSQFLVVDEPTGRAMTTTMDAGELDRSIAAAIEKLG